MHRRFLTVLCAVAVVGAFVAFLNAADHTDAPLVSGTTADISDFYLFESPANSDNVVFVCNVQGLLSPPTTGDAAFDPDVMIEFNIDNTGDNIEDLVIQCVFTDTDVTVYGPVAPASPGANSVIQSSASKVEAAITSYEGTVQTGSNNGVTVFAGPRDDPFFFDLNAFQAVLQGAATEFDNPGTDTFAGTNVLACVVEVPKSQLGGPALNCWAETKRKQL